MREKLAKLFTARNMIFVAVALVALFLAINALFPKAHCIFAGNAYQRDLCEFNEETLVPLGIGQ